MFVLASLAVAVPLAGYAVLCAAQPFTAAGKLRAGRRALNAWRRTRDAGAR